MARKVCSNGHQFEKTSDCPVCPVCSAQEMNNKYGEEFPHLGAPAFRALDQAGITKLTDLIHYTEKDLLSLHGFGPKGLKVLRESLTEKGLAFAKKK